VIKIVSNGTKFYLNVFQQNIKKYINYIFV